MQKRFEASISQFASSWKGVSSMVFEGERKIKCSRFSLRIYKLISPAITFSVRSGGCIEWIEKELKGVVWKCVVSLCTEFATIDCQAFVFCYSISLNFQFTRISIKLHIYVYKGIDTWYLCTFCTNFDENCKDLLLLQ